MLIRFKDKEVSAVVLDFDGVLYSDKLQNQIWAESRLKMVDKIFENLGQADVSSEERESMLAAYIESAREIGWSEAFIKLGGKIEDYHHIIANVSKAEFLTYDDQLVTLLNDLLAHLPVYIFTGSNRETVLEALKILIGDAWTLFKENLLASDDMENSHKPESAAYKEMIDKLGINPETTVFVDDQPVEVNAASGFGILTFLVQEERQDGDFGQHTVISSVHELFDHLEFVD